MNGKKTYYIALIVLYLLALGVRIYWISQKDGLMIDEALSVSIVYDNEYMYSKQFPFNEEFSGKQLKEMSLCDKVGLKNTVKDIGHLWLNAKDNRHTNFYYSLLRLSLAELKTGDIKDIIFRGTLLNLLLFSVSFFFFFRLMRLLFQKNKILPLIAVFCTFISTGTISNTLLLREYQLQETLLIIFVYYFCRTINIQKIILLDKKVFINLSFLFVMSIITALTLSTGYYSTIFIGLFGAYICYYHINRKTYKEIPVYFLTLLCAIIFAEILYPRFLLGFLPGTVKNTSPLAYGITNNISVSFSTIIMILNKYYFTIPVLIIIFLLLIYVWLLRKKIVFTMPDSFILIASFIYVVIVTYFAPFKVLRYSLPVFPFLIIFPMLLLQMVKDKKVFYFFSVVLCLGFILNVFNINNVEHVYKDKPKEYLFTENPEIPVFVVNDVRWYKYGELVPYFDDNQIYIFNDTFSNMDMDKYDDFYIIMQNSIKDAIDIDSHCFTTESIFNDVSYYSFACIRVKKIIL
jgi:hypothetical protein